MWWMIVISLLLAAFSGIARGVSNVIQFHYKYSAFRNRPWFDPSQSWKNKYKDGLPANGAAFPGSTTVFVAFTDGWHLFELLHRIFFASAFVIGGVIIAGNLGYIPFLFGLYITFAAFFHLTFEIL